MRVDRPIAIAIILFTILLLIFFLVVPEYKTFKKLRVDLGEKKAEYNAEFDYYAEITKKYYELKNRKEDLEKVDNALPEDPNLGRIVYYFQKTASENGMIIKDLFLSRSSATKDSGNINEIVFSMDLMGNYSSLGSFLSSLEKSDRIFEVTNISFGSGPSGENLSGESSFGPTQFQIQQTYTFTLQVKTHSY